jgi:hypothetical protein
MLAEMSVMLKISSSCCFFGFHVGWEAFMLHMEAFERTSPESQVQPKV